MCEKLLGARGWGLPGKCPAPRTPQVTPSLRWLHHPYFAGRASNGILASRRLGGRAYWTIFKN